MKKNKDSSLLGMLDSYVTVYLPVSIGLSENTVASYKCTFRLLLRFFHEKEHPCG